MDIVCSARTRMRARVRIREIDECEGCENLEEMTLAGVTRQRAWRDVTGADKRHLDSENCIKEDVMARRLAGRGDLAWSHIRPREITH